MTHKSATTPRKSLADMVESVFDELNTEIARLNRELAAMTARVEKAEAELAEIHTGMLAGEVPAPKEYTEVGQRNYLLGVMQKWLTKAEHEREALQARVAEAVGHVRRLARYETDRYGYYNHSSQTAAFLAAIDKAQEQP